MIGDTYVVGMSAFAQSGKDTAAGFLQDYFRVADVRSERYAYASSLKHLYAAGQEAFALNFDTSELFELYDLYKVTNEQRHMINDFFKSIFMKNPDLAADEYIVRSEESKIKHRPNLITFGQFVRQIDQDFWMNCVASMIEQEQPDFAIITDLRFQNETRIVDDIIRVIRVGVPQILNEKGELDESERYARDGAFEFAVYNNTSFLALKKQIAPLSFQLIANRNWKLFRSGRVEKMYTM